MTADPKLKEFRYQLLRFRAACQRIGSADPSLCFDPYIAAYQRDATEIQDKLVQLFTERAAP